jgi:NAD(P)-dependent dehydrogenase (short-subunit alcohol dehydrogenase family)
LLFDIIGKFFLTNALLPLIAQGGKILNVYAGLTRFAIPGYAAYATMKGGIAVRTQYLAKELEARGITVNVLAPEAIEIDCGGGAVRDTPWLNAFLASQTALGRVGKPDDIGGIIGSLLSDDATWINAQRIEASGGMMIWGSLGVEDLTN